MLEPPPWLVDELQNRLFLLVNHLVMQEPQAQDRLKRQKGRVGIVKWRFFAIEFVVTPAGLLARAQPGVQPDLSLAVVETSPLVMLRKMLQAQKPEVRIEGDVQFAAEINWLADHLRWDMEEDLSRLIGDAPAHALAEAARGAAGALGSFVAGRTAPSATGPGQSANRREG